MDLEMKISPLSHQSETEGEQDTTVMLISLVKANMFIYDKSDRRHKDRHLIDRTWAQIARDLGMNVGETKSKWTRLRNNFLKAIERRNAKFPRGSAAGQHRVKQWIYEPEMDFLRGHLKTYRRSTSVIKTDYCTSAMNLGGDESSASLCPLESEASESNVEMERYDEHESETNATRKALSRSDEMDGFMMDFLKEAHQRKDDPLVGWFKSFLPHLNTLTPMRLLEFQAKVTMEVRSALTEQEREEKNLH